MEGYTQKNTFVFSAQMDSSNPSLVPAAASLSNGDANGKTKVQNDVVSAAAAAIDNRSTTANSDQPQAATFTVGRSSKLDMDQRKLRRVMSNRHSAQRSRERKMQYVSNLEFQVKAYQAHMDQLIPQVQYYENHKLKIMFENEQLSNEIARLVNETSLREGEIEKSKIEVNKLRQVHTMQQEQLQALMLKNGSTTVEPMLNGQVSNHYYQGNGHENFELPPAQDMWATAVLGEHETNLNLTNCVGPVEITTQNVVNHNLNHHFTWK